MTEKPVPWYLRVFQALSAWFAAAFLIAWLVLLSHAVGRDSFLFSGLFACVASIWMQRGAKKKSLFLSQLALSVCLAGEALLCYGLLTGRGYDSSPYWGMVIVEVLIFWLYPEFLKRLLSAMAAWAFLALALGRFHESTAQTTLVSLWAASFMFLITHQDFEKRGLSGEALPLMYSSAIWLLGFFVVHSAGHGLLRWNLDWQIVTIVLGACLAYVLLQVSERLRLGGPASALMLGFLGCLAWICRQSPGVLASLLVILAAYERRWRNLVGLALAFLAVYLVLFFYNLSLTLFEKAELLLASGTVFGAAAVLVIFFSPRAERSKQFSIPTRKTGIREKAQLAAALLLVCLVNGRAWRSFGFSSSAKIYFAELVSLDPRAPLLGDYMALNYRLSASVGAGEDGPGVALVSADPRGVLGFMRVALYDDKPGAGKLLLRFNRSQGRALFGAEQYPIPEGRADWYRGARYGGWALDENGSVALQGLYDESLRKLGAVEPAPLAVAAGPIAPPWVAAPVPGVKVSESIRPIKASGRSGKLVHQTEDDFNFGSHDGQIRVLARPARLALQKIAGTLGPSQVKGRLPSKFVGPATWSVGRRLYLAGGNAPEGRSILTTTVSKDGSLEAWKVAGKLPWTTSFLGVARWQNFLFLGGGGDKVGATAHLALATLDAQGAIVAIKALNGLPLNEYSPHLMALGGKLYYLPQSTAQNPANQFYVAEIRADGNLSPWQASGPWIEDLTQFSVAQAANTAYVLGGERSNWEGESGVHRASFDPAGNPGPWRSSSPLPSGRSWLSASPVGQAGKLFLVGGKRFEGGDRYFGTVFSTQVLPDGSLTSWKEEDGLGGGDGIVFGSLAFAGEKLWYLGGVRSPDDKRSSVFCWDLNPGPAHAASGTYSNRFELADEQDLDSIDISIPSGQDPARLSVRARLAAANGVFAPWLPPTTGKTTYALNAKARFVEYEITLSDPGLEKEIEVQKIELVPRRIR